MIIEGNISVKAVLQCDHRIVDHLYIQDGKRSKDISYIVALAHQKNIEISFIDKEQLQQMTSGNTSGGVICSCQQRACQDLKSFKDYHFITLLDGIEDPFNLGYCFRSLYSFGCQGVILPYRNWGDSESQIIKSSAGAYEHMPIYLSQDLASDIQYLSDNHTIVSAFRNHAISCLDYKWPQNSVLVIGGEMRGINKEVLALSNQNIYIPYSNEFKNALNASSACSVLAYSYMQSNR